ncbi:hypothetical protein JW930_00975 [Candidatus Woesearchaeota archaeon]|nr:hypothetical protein [Candidatus Woesearchaeota archaeon]
MFTLRMPKQREQRRFKVSLSAYDIIDVMFIKEKEIIHKFALNYRAWIKDKWEEIYRVDNFHGFLHEQRFWISHKPVPLSEKEQIPLKEVMTRYLNEIRENYERYKFYFINSKKGENK